MMAKQRILEAAAELAEADGVVSLSLEKVAERAGVSKGGLLYHFNTKEAMMIALMQSAIDAHERNVTTRVENGQRYSEAVIDCCFDKAARHKPLMPGFVAAVATDRTAQELITTKRKGWHQRLVEDGLSLGNALLLTYALDGIIIGQGLGIAQMNETEGQAMRESLLALTRPRPEEQLAEWFEAALKIVDNEVLATNDAS